MPVDTSPPVVVTGSRGIRPPSITGAASPPLYDAFISYSHAKDKALASVLQSAIQRLGKPWYRRRALRLFRDDTSLTATPHLWPSIEKALGQTRFLILMASPEAAASRWVNQELAWWIDHKGADTVLIALTEGELEWDGEAGCFRTSETLPLPPALAGKFVDEPLWIDLRPYRNSASPRDARFTDLAASIAATLHGRAKEDLLSQEVRQQRRALRLAGAAVAMLLILVSVAGWQWNAARVQRNRAEQTLALATRTANGLVFDLAQKFRDSSVPSAVISDVLSRARGLQDQLNAGGETSSELRRAQAAALDEVAQTLLTLGDTKGALAAAQQSRDILLALAAATVGDADYQRNLGVTNERIGDVLEAQGDLTGALAAFRQSLSIVQTLLKTDPSNVDWQRDLAVRGGKIGVVLGSQGDLAGALAALRESLATIQALAKKDPGNSDHQRGISITDTRIGKILMAQGDLAGALVAYRDSLEIMKSLVQKEPDNTDWQRNLALSDGDVGEVLMAQDDLTGALAVYRDALDTAKGLTKKAPDNSRWQRDLSVADDQVGDALNHAYPDAYLPGGHELPSPPRRLCGCPAAPHSSAPTAASCAIEGRRHPIGHDR
jgi:tetratricopeptide (TPR) repeat protein